MLPSEVFQSAELSAENIRCLRLLEETEFEAILNTKWTSIASDASSLHKDWPKSLEDRVAAYCTESKADEKSKQYDILFLGLSALYAFLQANVTGPPLSWDPAKIVPRGGSENDLRRQIISSLSSDGQAAYHLAPHIELFSIAKIVLNVAYLPREQAVFAWARLSVNFWHQQLLNESSSTLQSTIDQDISFLDSAILGSTSNLTVATRSLYLLEKAAVDIFHGLDKRARANLDRAVALRGFEYILTGLLGRRTKFQQFDISQLVVLAKSADKPDSTSQGPVKSTGVKPDTLELNDDTILESISFSKPLSDQVTDELVPESLAQLDPAKQPILDPLDSIILLSVASSITNTSPQHGLTREETLPYATRVLDDSSTNWQLYTQALLVRSRIEGYKSRTVERGLLQLQALVDQVIAETSGTSDSAASATTFLPRPKPSESASPAERLLYIDQLGSPLRWSLEAELASKWVSLGGLRTALEIFERLEMWAEVALCWAASDEEDKARKIVRRQLYYRSNPELKDDGGELYLGSELDLLPADAPRLFCILGDIEKEAKHYERAWEVSNRRFARAQRSLGKHYVTLHELAKADDAYVKSLAVNPQNSGTWFSLGCVRLETQDWPGAVRAFTRMVQLEQDDAEAWSNLAAALLRLPPEKDILDTDGEIIQKGDPQKHKKEAYKALMRATSLKRESYRIWQNLLNVAATITPPPYSDLIVAQKQIIELRGDSEGEGCVDVEVLEGLLSHIMTIEHSKYGIQHMYSQLIWKQVVPLITHSRRLWQLVARVAIFENKPSTALDAYEKAWRATLNIPGWDDGTRSGSATSRSQAVTPEKAWDEVMGSTLELVDAYESLGEKEVTEGLAAGSGELVCKNWKYKARMAIRSVIGRRTKAGFDDVDALSSRAEDLKK